VADLLLDKTILRGALSSLQTAVTAAVARIRETRGLAGSQGSARENCMAALPSNMAAHEIRR
jgi:hypothetical protein